MEEKEMYTSDPNEMSKEMHKFFEHVKTHDPSKLRFGIVIAGHGLNDESGPDAHICSFVAGPPPVLAQVIIELIDELIKRDPAFGMVFTLGLLRQAKISKNRALEALMADKFDRVGGEDAEQTLAKLLDEMGIPNPKGRTN